MRYIYWNSISCINKLVRLVTQGPFNSPIVKGYAHLCSTWVIGLALIAQFYIFKDEHLGL